MEAISGLGHKVVTPPAQAAEVPPQRGIAAIGAAIKALNVIFDTSKEKSRALSRLSNSLAKASDAMKVKDSEEDNERVESLLEAEMDSIGESVIRA